MSNEIGTAVHLSKPKKDDKYYIASGFFNPAQVATVDKIEDSLKKLNQMYFSPRAESVEFFKENDAEIKSMMTKLIFNNNLDSMESCNKFIINLMDEDQGTVFEYGYIVGSKMARRCKPSVAMSRNIKIMNDKSGLEFKVLQSVKSNGLDPSFIEKGKDYSYVKSIITNLENINLAFDNSDLLIVSIDDRDPINMFLIGYYYALEIPIITYSKQGYGSNVMLVHSTYHCETDVELETLLKELDEERWDFMKAELGDYLIRLRMNKQTWEKNID